nr:hypothetical protein CFP56_57809 [Quercus suber]
MRHLIAPKLVCVKLSGQKASLDHSIEQIGAVCFFSFQITLSEGTWIRESLLFSSGHLGLYLGLMFWESSVTGRTSR